MLKLWQVSLWLALRWLILLVLLLFDFLVLLVCRTTTHKEAKDFVPEGKTIVLLF